MAFAIPKETDETEQQEFFARFGSPRPVDPEVVEEWMDLFERRKRLFDVANPPHGPVVLSYDLPVVYFHTEVVRRVHDLAVSVGSAGRVVGLFGCEGEANGFASLRVFLCAMRTPCALLNSEVYESYRDVGDIPNPLPNPIPTAGMDKLLEFQFNYGSRIRRMGLAHGGFRTSDEFNGYAHETPFHSSILDKRFVAVIPVVSRLPGNSFRYNILFKGTEANLSIGPGALRQDNVYDHGSQCCPIGR